MDTRDPENASSSMSPLPGSAAADAPASSASTQVRLCIFDPSPIVTVTIESGGAGDEIHLHAGGQGVWIARMARQLGAEARLVSAFGGEAGDILPTLIESAGIAVTGTQSHQGNGAYVQDRRSGTRTSLAESVPAPLSRHEADDLYGTALAAAVAADVMVLAGPRPEQMVPAEFYGRLTADLAELGKPVVADLSGEVLHHVVAGGVKVLKVSEEDLRRDGLLTTDSPSERLQVLRELHRTGAAAVIVTRADQPAVALVDGRVVEIHGPSLRAVDHRGAGDAMTAAIAVQVGAGATLIAALRLGAAAGAAAVTRRGLASGRLDEVDALVEFVDICPPRALAT